jgi:competence protein ComGC
MNPSEPDPKTSGGDLPPTPAPDSAEPILAKKKPRLSLARCVIVVVLIGLIAAIAIPNFVKARTTKCRSACLANLKQIDGAQQQWALENKKGGKDVPDMQGVVVYLKGSVLPLCPAGGSYHVGKTVSDPPTCSGNRDGDDGHKLLP